MRPASDDKAGAVDTLSIDGAGLIEEAYARLEACSDNAARIAATAQLLLVIFDDFYEQLCEYPFRAKSAFERMDPHASLQVSKERLGLYSRYIALHGPRMGAAFPALGADMSVWDALDTLFLAMIVDRYEADIAFSFVNSIRRNIGHETWRPVAYSFPPPSKLRALSTASVHRRFAVRGRVDTELLRTVLQIPDFSVPFKDLQGDAQRILERVEGIFAAAHGMSRPIALDVVEAGFFRNRGAFIVGRWVMSDGGMLPLVVALLNSSAGIYADALLYRVSDIHDLFSSTLANFHVTTRLYYQTCVFLFSLMPRRPFGHQYSTIGYNHIGKVAIMNEIIEQIRAGHRFERSPGATGTVAVGFTFAACAYHLKVIRDQPTDSYKWGSYPGVAAVCDKYRVVHEINRAGSMLDNVIYYNLRLDREMFDPAVLDELCRRATESVHVDRDSVLLRSLIVQLKIIPLPVYLEGASADEIRAVIASLGHCMRNNAATNIFNKDLDSRNYGVGRYGRVFLFDYDAVEKLTDVKIRTNSDREPGEESVPAWFFEDGVIFLPEEIEHGMRFQSTEVRRAFREINGDLLTMHYWLTVQRKLLRGEILDVRTYPDSEKFVSNSGDDEDMHELAAGH
jgi:isocitrate dehydrogenase kinase/phosphatase